MGYGAGLVKGLKPSDVWGAIKRGPKNAYQAIGPGEGFPDWAGGVAKKGYDAIGPGKGIPFYKGDDMAPGTSALDRFKKQPGDGNPYAPVPLGLPSDPYSASDYWNVGMSQANAQYGGTSALLASQIERNRQRTGPGSADLAIYDSKMKGLRDSAGFDRRSMDVAGEGINVDRAGLDRNNIFIKDSAAADTGKVNRDSEYAQFKRQDQARAGGAFGSEGFRRDIRETQEDQRYGVGKIERDAKEATAANNQRKATLDLKSKQLGIDRERLESDLQNGLEQLGLSRTITSNDLLDKLSSSQMDEQVLGQRIFDRAMSLSQMYQQGKYLPPAYVAATKGRSTPPPNNAPSNGMGNRRVV